MDQSWRELGLCRVLHCTARILSNASLENLGKREEQVSVIRNAEFVRQGTDVQTSAQPGKEIVFLAVVEVFISLVSPLCWEPGRR